MQAFWDHGPLVLLRHTPQASSRTPTCPLCGLSVPWTWEAPLGPVASPVLPAGSSRSPRASLPLRTRTLLYHLSSLPPAPAAVVISLRVRFCLVQPCCAMACTTPAMAASRPGTEQEHLGFAVSLAEI